MPLCATYNVSGVVSIVSPPPADMSTCALLIPTVGDSVNDPFHLSASDGSAIAIAIAALWFTAYVVRLLIKTIR